MNRTFHVLSSAGGDSDTNWSVYTPTNLPPIKQGVSSLFGWYAFALNICNLGFNVYFGFKKFDNNGFASMPVMLAFAGMALFSVMSQIVVPGLLTQYILSVFNIIANLLIAVCVRSVVEGEFAWFASHFQNKDFDRIELIKKKNGQGRERGNLTELRLQAELATMTPLWERFLRAKPFWNRNFWVLGIFDVPDRRREMKNRASEYQALADEMVAIDDSEAADTSKVALLEKLRIRAFDNLLDKTHRQPTPAEHEAEFFRLVQTSSLRTRKQRNVAAKFREETIARAQEAKQELHNQVTVTLVAFIITTLGWGFGAFKSPSEYSYNLDGSPYPRMRLSMDNPKGLAAFALGWVAFAAMIVGRNWDYAEAFRFRRRGPKINKHVLKHQEQYPDRLQEAALSYARGQVNRHKTSDEATKYFTLYVGTCVDNFLSAISIFTGSTNQRYIIYQTPYWLAGFVSSGYDFIMLYLEWKRYRSFGPRDSKAFRGYGSETEKLAKQHWEDRHAYADNDHEFDEKNRQYRDSVKQIKRMQKKSLGEAKNEARLNAAYLKARAKLPRHKRERDLEALHDRDDRSDTSLISNRDLYSDPEPRSRRNSMLPRGRRGSDLENGLNVSPPGENSSTMVNTGSSGTHSRSRGNSFDSAEDRQRREAMLKNSKQGRELQVNPWS